MSDTSDFSGNSPGDLAFLRAEADWTSGGPPRQGRNHQQIPLDRWLNDQLSVIKVEKPDGDEWLEREVLGREPTGTTLIMSGRGWGKTRTGASWVRRMAGMYPGSVTHIIAPTYGDLRGVVFEGPSGLINTIPEICVKGLSYSPYPEITLWNGSIIRGFSSESPDRLRGPQATFVWGDELASWYRPQDCLSNIDFSTRIAYRKPDGELIQPQKLYTTTPKPLQWLAQMIKRKPRLVRGSTYENRANLAEDYFREVTQYEGTQIGRQELHGELIDITESAIIKQSWLRMWPHDRELPWFEYIIVSMDTAFTEKTYDKKSFASDPTACSTWGVFKWEKKWNLLLLDAWEEWLGFPQLLVRARREMKAIYGQREEAIFQPMIADPYHKGFIFKQQKKADVLVIEDKGSGISLRQTLENEGISAHAFNPGRADKIARLHVVSHIPHNGRIWIPEGRRRPAQAGGKVTGSGEFSEWTKPLIEQLCTYSGPGTTPHDDWVDTCSQGWRVFMDQFLRGGVERVLEGSDQRAGDNSLPPTNPTTLIEDQRHDYLYKPQDHDLDYETVRSEPATEFQRRGVYDG